MKNPFAYGRVVEGQEFCPRPKLEKLIHSMLESGQNMVLHGERRVGKTSLVVHAAGKMKQSRLLYVDFMAVNTAVDVAERIARAALKLSHKGNFIAQVLKLLSSLSPVISMDPQTGTPSLSLNRNSIQQDVIRVIEDVLERLADLHKEKPLVVVFDEFQEILKIENSQEALARMRSKIQFQGDLPYVFSGSSRSKMEHIFSDPESPFYKSAISVQVGSLSSDAFKSFLSEKFAESDRKISNELWEAITELGIHVTGDVQQMCWALWQSSESGDELTEVSLTEGVEIIFEIESSKYGDTVSTIAPSQLKCLLALASVGGKAVYSKEFKQVSGITTNSSITKALGRLEDLWHINHIGKEYSFANPFFAIWLKQKFSGAVVVT
ncbi:ATP-binding protein [Opitutia bacterium ISCC 51]|nr:ATP-binding protein [Opitutae bacterium ISCC 51]QXD28120.1 ATP-binding protein [Opitutae bacterium ISCC 52]